MEHLAYYNVGCEPAPGVSKVKLWVRRQFRRILLPSTRRAAEILASIVQRLDADEHEIRDLRGQVDDLRRRHDDQSARIPATMAFGWDYVAMVRRLAVLEEHVDSLMAARPEESALAAEPAPAASPVPAAGLAPRPRKS